MVHHGPCTANATGTIPNSTIRTNYLRRSEPTLRWSTSRSLPRIVQSALSDPTEAAGTPARTPHRRPATTATRRHRDCNERPHDRRPLERIVRPQVSRRRGVAVATPAGSYPARSVTSSAAAGERPSSRPRPAREQAADDPQPLAGRAPDPHSGQQPGRAASQTFRLPPAPGRPVHGAVRLRRCRSNRLAGSAAAQAGEQPGGDALGAWPSPYGLPARAISASAVRRQEPRGRRDDPVALGPDQLERAGLDPLGPLGLVAHDQDRLAEAGRLLLESAAVGQDEGRSARPPGPSAS